MPESLTRLRAALQRRLRYRITRGGLLFALAVILVAVAAGVSANNLLFLLLAAMFSTLLISGFINRLCLAGLEMELALPEHICAGHAVTARLSVRNLKSWMPSFSIRVTGVEEPGGTPGILTMPLYFPVIPGGAVLGEMVEVRFPRRGAYRQNTFAFSTRFPFGFLDKTARVTLRHEVLVYPSISPQPGFEELLFNITGEIEAHLLGLGKDFYRIRPYDAFESARHLDWKASAHTGDLQIREFARDEERAVEIFLDRDVASHQEAWFEQAVECCAYLAWSLSEQGTGIRFRSQQFDVRVPEEGDIYTILKYLARVYPQRGTTLEAPPDDNRFQIVLTAAPQRFEEMGWVVAHRVGPGDLPGRAG